MKKNDKLRKPYYALADAVVGFINTSTDVNDLKLIRKAKALEKTVAEIGKHLDKNYLWD